MPLTMRMSAAGHCPRSIAYRSLGFAESDPPDQAGQNRMALGNAAELLIIKHMQKLGYETALTKESGAAQLEVTLDSPPMTGHPDGICRHPVHTQNQWVGLECKSMYDDQMTRVETEGLATIYPEYVAQTALYANALYDRKLVAYRHRAIFGIMSRDGNVIEPQLVSWDSRRLAEVKASLGETWSHIERGHLPAAPYQPDDPKCAECRFFTTCHNPKRLSIRKTRKEAPLNIIEPTTVELASQYQEAKDRVDAARARLREICEQNQKRDIIAGRLRAGFFQPSPARQYDPDTLRKYLTSAQLHEAEITRQPAPAFWIRPHRRPTSTRP